jgi:MFS family permease
MDLTKTVNGKTTALSDEDLKPNNSFNRIISWPVMFFAFLAMLLFTLGSEAGTTFSVLFSYSQTSIVVLNLNIETYWFLILAIVCILAGILLLSIFLDQAKNKLFSMGLARNVFHKVAGLIAILGLFGTFFVLVSIFLSLVSGLITYVTNSIILDYDFRAISQWLLFVIIWAGAPIFINAIFNFTLNDMRLIQSIRSFRNLKLNEYFSFGGLILFFIGGGWIIESLSAYLLWNWLSVAVSMVLLSVIGTIWLYTLLKIFIEKVTPYSKPLSNPPKPSKH